MKILPLILAFLLVASIAGIAYATDFDSSFRKRVNISASAYNANQTWYINHSLANITVQNGKGMEIKVTDFDNKLVAYQTVINGIWYYKGAAHNVSADWQKSNYTVILLNKSTANCCYVYFDNITQLPDLSTSILIMKDEFESYALGTVPPFMGGTSSLVLQTNGQKAFGNIVAVNPVFQWFLNYTDNLTFFVEENATDYSTAANDIILAFTPGYRVQETVEDQYQLTDNGGTNIGNATFINNFAGGAINVTFFTAGDRVQFVLTNTTAGFLTHIGADNTVTRIFTGANDNFASGTGRKAIYQYTLFNRTVFAWLGQPKLTFGPVEIGILKILAPQAITYFSNNVTLMVNLTGNDSAYSCWRNLDGVETFLGSLPNNTVTNQSITGLSQANHTLLVTCQNDGINSTDSVIFGNIHFNISVAYPAFILETQLSYFNSSITVIPDVVGINSVILIYNMTSYASTAGASSGQVFNFTNTLSPVIQGLAGSVNHLFYYNITIQYTNGSSYTYQSLQFSQNVNKIFFSSCTGNNGNNQTINFTIYDEEQPSLLVNAKLDISFNVTTSADSTSGVIFNFTGSGRNTYAFCLGPSNSTIYVDTIADFSNLTQGYGYKQRNYYTFNAPLSNLTSFVNLYLLNNTATLAKLSVADINTNPVPNVHIVIQRYYPNLGTYISVAHALTDSNGAGITYLRPDDILYQVILEQNNQIVRTFIPQKFVTDATGTIIATFRLSVGSGSEYFDYLAGIIGYSCVYTNSTTTLRCTISDTSGITRTTDLVVNRITATGSSQVCDTSSTSSTAILLCDLSVAGTTANQTYFYQLFITNPRGTKIQLTSDYIYLFQGLPPTGIDGLVFAFFLFLLLSFAGVHSPVLSLTLGAISLIASIWMGMLVIPAAALAGLLVTFALVIWKMKRA